MSLIQKITTLCNLSDGAQKFLQERVQRFEFKKNEIILNDRSICEYLYLVNSGLLRGYYFNDAKEVTNWIATEDDFGTSFYSLISQQTGYETIEAIENSSVDALHKKDMDQLYAQFPETEKAGRILLENYYLRLEERMIYTRFKTAKERYQHFFENKRELVKRAPLGSIASYLGITQETLSRIRAEK
ncbi:MAG: putative transcriptional regulator, Crp/Fnr family [Bacteroidetes bacterium]|jgi:CRP-like cAMP-binding protein|nr:putative transcriptional regulator, Crp/Fnr family [Bacteroidota bacterium]